MLNMGVFENQEHRITRVKYGKMRNDLTPKEQSETARTQTSNPLSAFCLELGFGAASSGIHG